MNLIRWVWARRRFARLYPIGLFLLMLMQRFAPRRNGLLALAQVFSPYLFLPLLALVPAALRRGAWPLRAGLLWCVWIYQHAFGWWWRKREPVAPGDGTPLRVLSWNTLEGGRPEQIRPLLLEQRPDVVALVEADGGWIAADRELRELYPYRVLRRGKSTASMALLSRFPFVERIDAARLDAWRNPLRLVWARLDLGAGKTLLMVVAHPPPPYLSGGSPLALGYSVYERDGAVRQIREFVDPHLRRDENLLLVGDFNMTTRDPAYKDMSAGLQDAQRRVGRGYGLSWRPESLRGLPVVFLRIDYQLSSPRVVPVSLEVDRTPRGSDHCPVLGQYEVQ